MRSRRWWNYTFAGLILLVGLTAQAWADPPARVGRLNYLDGAVSFQPASLDEWAPATINYPLTTGDHLWTDDESRAELHVGSTAIRLGQDTDFSFLNLDDETTQIRLAQGSINIRLRQLYEDQAFEVDTPNVTVSLVSPGTYRIDVDPNGNNTMVTVRDGESEITADGSAFPVYSEQTATVSGVDSPSYDIEDASYPDDWDNWCVARDQREDDIRSVRYVPREEVGYEDLDSYGSWRDYPEYGHVWIPTQVDSGWAPYRYGRWAWVEPWGWTWIDDAPWGFAPFHYGRWAYLGGSWAWIPGQVVARPVYAPALVAFIGGNNFGLSLSFGGGSGIGWFPLGPREVYVPAYRVSPTYIRNVNITNVNVRNINVTNYNVTNYNAVNTTYVNQTVPGAVTAVPQAVFTGSRPVAQAAVVVPAKAVAAARVVPMTAPPVAPQKESVLAARPVAARAVAQPPAAAAKRPVVARLQPPPPPVPFTARVQALQANKGRPLDTATLSTLRQSVPATRPPVKVASVGNAREATTAPALRPARAGLAAPHPVQTARPVVQTQNPPPRRSATGTTARPPQRTESGNSVNGAPNTPRPVSPPTTRVTRTREAETETPPPPRRKTPPPAAQPDTTRNTVNRPAKPAGEPAAEKPVVRPTPQRPPAERTPEKTSQKPPQKPSPKATPKPSETPKEEAKPKPRETP